MFELLNKVVLKSKKINFSSFFFKAVIRTCAGNNPVCIALVSGKYGRILTSTFKVIKASFILLLLPDLTICDIWPGRTHSGSSGTAAHLFQTTGLAPVDQNAHSCIHIF